MGSQRTFVRGPRQPFWYRGKRSTLLVRNRLRSSESSGSDQREGEKMHDDRSKDVLICLVVKRAYRIFWCFQESDSSEGKTSKSILEKVKRATGQMLDINCPQRK